MYNMTSLLYLLTTYLVGAIPFGVIVSLAVSGRDVRKQGSGNIGATNVSRLMGKKWGLFVLFLDGLKGFLVVMLAYWFFSRDLILPSLGGLMAVIGHCFPIYLKFKGGKGVATALGVIAALSPMILGICCVVFALAMLITRRVSAGSLAAAAALPVAAFVISPRQISVPVATVMTILIWWKHRENIKRLVRGQEPKFF
jgi:glycerol-3-phosphate acyltransferase PlsY